MGRCSGAGQIPYIVFQRPPAHRFLKLITSKYRPSFPLCASRSRHVNYRLNWQHISTSRKAREATHSVQSIDSYIHFYTLALTAADVTQTAVESSSTLFHGSTFCHLSFRRHIHISLSRCVKGMSDRLFQVIEAVNRLSVEKIFSKLCTLIFL